MDFFCKECSAKPGWLFDPEKAFIHSCQRCFSVKPCNDYEWRRLQQGQAPSNQVQAAPKPGELIHDSKEHIDLPLPRPKASAFDKAGMSADEKAQVEEKEKAANVIADAKVEAAEEKKKKLK